MAHDDTRGARAGAAEPRDRIRSIYAARSAAFATSAPGDFARIKTADPDRSLRTAYMAHLFTARAAAAPDASPPGEDALRRAYVAHAIGEPASPRGPAGGKRRPRRSRGL
jgi:hypothetical protein